MSKIWRLLRNSINFSSERSMKMAVTVLVLWAIILSVIAGQAGIFVFIMAAIITVAAVNRKKREYIFYFAVAFLVTSVIMCAIFYLQIHIRGNSVLYGDTRYYIGCLQEYGTDYSPDQIYNNNVVNSAYTFFGLTIPQSGFIYVIGLLGWIFGADINTSVISFNLYVSFFGALAILYSTKLCMVTTGNGKITKYTFWISLLYPHFLLFSGVLLKDMLTVLLTVFIAYQAITLHEKKALKIIAIILALVLYMFTRYRFALIMFELVLVSFVIPRKEKLSLRSVFSFNKRKIILIILIIVSSVLIIKFAYAGSTEYYYAQSDLKLETTTGEDIYNAGLDETDIDQSDTLTDNDFGFNKVAYKLPIGIRELYRFGYTMVYPFNSWSCLSSPDIEMIKSVLTDIGSLYWLICLPFLLAGTIETIKKKEFDNVNIVYMVAIVMVLAIFNYIRVRWRLIALPFMAVLIAIGFYRRKEYKKLILASSILLAALFIFYIGYSIVRSI